MSGIRPEDLQLAMELSLEKHSAEIRLAGGHHFGDVDHLALAKSIAVRLPDDPARCVTEDWLDHFGDSSEHGWEPEQTDGCWPYACECGFIDLVHRSRLAVGRPCCGELEHPLGRRRPDR